MNENEKKWCRCAKDIGGGFVSAFADACLRADLMNFAILRPGLEQMMHKYPHYLMVGR